VKVLRCERRGQAPARNKGIRESCGDIICFTDSDVIIPDDWLKKISDFFERHSEVDGIGGPVFPPSAGYKNLVQKLIGEVYFEDQQFPKVNVRPNLLSYVGSFYSANCAYRSDVLASVNGFNESLWDGNDIDLCWRLIKKGRNLIFTPDIRVVHLGFAYTIIEGVKKHFKWGRINTLLIKAYSKTLDEENDRILRVTAFSFYSLVRSMLLALFIINLQNEKKMLRLCLHLAFHLGRVLEVVHPLKFKRVNLC